MAQAHPLDSLGDPARLAQVEGAGAAAADLAVGAGAGADLAQDQEGSGAALPALAQIGAVRLLADGVEAGVAHEIAQTRVVLPGGELGLEPGGFGLSCGGHDARIVAAAVVTPPAP